MCDGWTDRWLARRTDRQIRPKAIVAIQPVAIIDPSPFSGFRGISHPCQTKINLSGLIQTLIVILLDMGSFMCQCFGNRK